MLGWLTAHNRINYVMKVMIYKCINYLAFKYLTQHFFQFVQVIMACIVSSSQNDILVSDMKTITVREPLVSNFFREISVLYTYKTISVNEFKAI